MLGVAASNRIEGHVRLHTNLHGDLKHVNRQKKMGDRRIIVADGQNFDGAIAQ